MTQSESTLRATCRCGKVVFNLARAPLLAASCYCTSCQEAGHQFEKLASAPHVLDKDGGTPVVVYRKDRIQCVAGREHLEARRLKPDSPTRRVFATCCNSPLFVDFTKGHWLSIYRNRFSTPAPAPEMRVMTKYRPAGVVLADDVPNYEGYSGKFMRKLILAWIAMGFGRPDMGLKDIPGSTFDGDRATEGKA